MFRKLLIGFVPVVALAAAFLSLPASAGAVPVKSNSKYGSKYDSKYGSKYDSKYNSKYDSKYSPKINY